MKTLFCVTLLASLLAVSACGKKEEPAAAADASGGDAAAAAPAPDTAASGAALPAEAAEAAETVEATAEASATTDAAPVTTTSSTTTTTTAAAVPPAAAAVGSTTAAATTTTPAATTLAAKPAAAPSTTAPAAATASTAASTGTVSMNGDPGTMIRAEILRMRPAADAPEAGSIAASAKVKVLARDGGWYQVSGDGKTGWVRMLSVRRSESATTSVAGIAGIASGRTGTGKVVTTTGVRGLDSGDLSAAAFDGARIAKAESMRVSRADADAFARQAGLAPQTVAALPAPAK